MLCYDFYCPKCEQTYEGEFENFADYDKQMAEGSFRCEKDNEVLKRDFSTGSGVHIPDSFRAGTEDNTTHEFARHTMKNAKRPTGKSKVYF